jgi:hypothetical protein
VENGLHGQRKGRGRERTDVKLKQVNLIKEKVVQMWFVCFFLKKLEFRNQSAGKISGLVKRFGKRVSKEFAEEQEEHLMFI